MATVSYNGHEFSPTPFVSKVEKMVINGSYTYPITEFKLNGFVTGDVSGQVDSILDSFSGDFQSFLITDTNSFSGGENYICSVKGLNFSPSRASGVSNYSIELECYRPSGFSGLSIKDPKNEWTYKEGTDGIITLNHKISANGIKSETGESAFDAARDFVTGFTGLSSKVSGFFGRNSNTGEYTLVSVSKTINHATASYGVEEVYKLATSGEAGAFAFLETSSCSVESGIDKDFTTVKLNVAQQNSPTGGAAPLNAILSSGYLFGVASSLSEVDDLNNEPISFDVSFAPTKTNYEISFTNDPLGVTYFDFNQSITFDEVAQLTSVSIEGVIKSKGNLKQRAENVSGFYEDTVGGDSGVEDYLYNLADDFYTSLSGDFTLRSKALSFLKQDSSYRGEINLSASFDDKDTLEGDVETSYTVDSNLAMPILIPRSSALVNGLYKVYDTKLNSRQVSSIQISSANSSGVASMKTAAYGLMDDLVSSYVPSASRVLQDEQLSITTGTINQLSFSNSYSCSGVPLISAVPPTV